MSQNNNKNNNHKRQREEEENGSPSSSSNQPPSKRQKTSEVPVIDLESQLDEKENKSEAKGAEGKEEEEAQEDPHAPSLSITDQNLAVPPLDQDFVCSICLELLTKPQSFGCGHCFCHQCASQLQVCPQDTQPVTKILENPYLQLKIAGMKMRCPNYKRGCKQQMLAGKEFQTVSNHFKVFHSSCSLSFVSSIFVLISAPHSLTLFPFFLNGSAGLCFSRLNL
jgi:hypothetical protein